MQEGGCSSQNSRDANRTRPGVKEILERVASGMKAATRKKRKLFDNFDEKMPYLDCTRFLIP
jgi:ribosomal protein L27